MIQKYLKGLYKRTMHEAYYLAHTEIINSLTDDGKCLDCGAHQGHMYDFLSQKIALKQDMYYGIEWNAGCVEVAVEKGLNIIEGDLNKEMKFANETFRCIFGLSVLEHLLNPCNYLKECYRCLENGGTLIILTPNISTYFTILLLLLGRMPSSGPHPDSDVLLKQEELFKVSHDSLQPDTETNTPVHRHLVVFSYKVLKSYLLMIGFKEVKGYGFGLYPFPNFLQKALERLDPYHCHQMVFIARK